MQDHAGKWRWMAIALVLMAPAVAASQQKPLTRGNASGEWRYWAADAWSTRYSPLDQIDASNFGSLQVAWQWNAGQFGDDEYYRTTPLYANGRLFTVATTRRIAVAIDPANGKTLWHWRLDEGIRWQKAPRQFAGRGLAYWTNGPNERVIVVTPGYHLASLDAKTGTPDPKFGKNGVVDLMDGLGYPLVPLDQRKQGLVAQTALVEFERRDAQPFLIDLGRVRGVGARHPAPDIGLVAHRASPGDRGFAAPTLPSPARG